MIDESASDVNALGSVQVLSGRELLTECTSRQFNFNKREGGINLRLTKLNASDISRFDDILFEFILLLEVTYQYKISHITEHIILLSTNICM